jgi:hypothetical protein
MKRLLRPLRILVPLLVLAHAAPAEAKLVEIWGSALAGYGYGDGDSGKDFYAHVRGGAVGAEVGVKILFIGAFIDYLRWFGGDFGANLITFNLGGDWDIGLTKRLSLIIRAAFGYYYGTLPDDAKYHDPDLGETVQVDTRGIGVRGGLGLRYSFWKVLSIGVTPEIGYHYFFGGADQSVTENNSSGYDINILAYFRVGVGI